VAGATGDDALAVLSADDEGSLLEAGDDGNAGGPAGNVVRNATIWSVHEFVENQVGGFDAVIEFLYVGGGCGHGQGCSDAKCLNKLSNHLKVSLLEQTFAKFQLL
jgi:hypothetical protein